MTRLVCSFALLIAASFGAAGPAHAACSTVLEVQLQTFGAGVTVELRRGSPGSSSVVASQKTTGGTIYFRRLCPGHYFMAIGNDEDVQVTPEHDFEDNHQYQSKITMQSGTGNIGRRSRKSL